MSIFSERLKLLRKENHITQDDLAKAINKSRPTIASYETDGRLPDIETLIKLVRFFNVSVDYLLGVVDNPISIKNTFCVSPKEQTAIESMRKMKPEKFDALLKLIE